MSVKYQFLLVLVLFFEKLGKLYRKTSVLESLFNGVSVFETCNFINKLWQQVFSFEFCEVFKNTYFVEYLQTVASKLIQTKEEYKII